MKVHLNPKYNLKFLNCHKKTPLIFDIEKKKRFLIPSQIFPNRFFPDFPFGFPSAWPLLTNYRTCPVHHLKLPAYQLMVTHTGRHLQRMQRYCYLPNLPMPFQKSIRYLLKKIGIRIILAVLEYCDFFVYPCLFFLACFCP